MKKEKLNNNPIKGFKTPFESIKLLKEPSLRLYIVIPLSISALIFIGALMLGIWYFEQFMTHFLDFSSLWQWLQAILEWIKPLLWLLFLFAYLIIVFYSAGIICELIAAPFNELLTEATIAHLSQRNVPPIASGLKQLLPQIWPIFAKEIDKLVYFLLRAVPLLLLFIIPFTVAFAPFVWFIFSSWMNSLQYMDYPMAMDKIGFRQQIYYQKQTRLYYLGFGGNIALLTMIPLINILAMPLAVVTAAKIWFERQEQTLSSS